MKQPSAKDMVSRVALVTGAGSGFGQLLTERLLEQGWRVYAGLRRVAAGPAGPRHGNHPQCRLVALDVTDDAQIARVVDAIRSREQRLDALVHCAGFDQAGAFEDLDMAAWRALMDVNFFGAVALTRAALPLMRARRQGVVLAVSSLSGLIGLPGNSAYAASKFALEGAFEALRHEVAPFGIGVALIEPGVYDTGVAARYRSAPGVRADSAYAALVAHSVAARAAPPSGRDPAEVIELMLEVIAQRAPRLRYPAGAQAQRVVETLRTLDDAGRAQFVAAIVPPWTAGDDER